jgi:hypothetical protein
LPTPDDDDAGNLIAPRTRALADYIATEPRTTNTIRGELRVCVNVGG